MWISREKLFLEKEIAIKISDGWGTLEKKLEIRERRNRQQPDCNVFCYWIILSLLGT